MQIRCWGARGSITVSGPQYNRYGGDTTCLEIRTSDDRIVIVDAGSGIRRLGNALLREERYEYTLLFTHVHWDHLLGFPFFKPAYMPQAKITVLGCPMKQGDMETHLRMAMSGPYFPVPFDHLLAQFHFDNTCTLEEPFEIGPMKVDSVPLSHPNQGLGYRFSENGRDFVLLTDNELSYEHRGRATYEQYVAFSRGADVLFHDAEYMAEDYKLTRSWGHSLYTDALELALDAGVKKLGLFHHNQDRSDDAVDALVADCRERIAEAGSDLECFAASHETVIDL